MRMAIVVTYEKEGGRYVVLGASSSKWATARGSALLGNLVPVENEGFVQVVAMAGADGRIRFADPALLRVVEVDGRPLSALLGDSAAHA